jgi:hypothetical protein
MSSFLFHGGGDEAAFLAPPPQDYADFTVDRAIWQALGKRPDEMTVFEYKRAALFLRLEAASRKKD